METVCEGNRNMDEGLRWRAPSLRYIGLATVIRSREPAACKAVERENA